MVWFHEMEIEHLSKVAAHVHPLFRRAPAVRRFRPALEQFETRILPSVNPYPPILVNPGNPATGTVFNEDVETP
jgi:hypothetical protein